MRRFAATLAMVAALAASPAWAQDGPPPMVRVESGQVLGVAHAAVEAFRNIPYAAPPVGALRWAPPQPAPPWIIPRDGALPGPSCPQAMNPDNTPNFAGANGPTSEDCLQLNVFAPKGAPNSSRRAPVMVWLHGGGHEAGAGWIYNGDAFARDGVVLVTLNYRLGALGYFAHPALTRAAGGQPTGNFGLMDQIAALRWVKRNIAAFGGDPGNVTLFGESAGAMSTLALLATPSAKGLYRRAIVESGGGWQAPVTLADKEQAGIAALASLGVPATAGLEDLRAIPADRLAGLKAAYGPFVDGRLMTETPAQALARGHFTDVPLIIGTNSGEDSLMGPPVADAAARALFTDRFMGAPARWVAAKASGGQPAYLYYFSYVGARFRPAMTRASHAAEIQYVFEYWGRRTPMSMVSDEDRAMAALMHACWVGFARTGVPRCGSTPWPAYSPRTDRLMEFGSESGVRTGFRKPQLDAQEAAVLPGLKLAN